MPVFPIIIIGISTLVKKPTHSLISSEDTVKCSNVIMQTMETMFLMPIDPLLQKLEKWQSIIQLRSYYKRFIFNFFFYMIDMKNDLYKIWTTTNLQYQVFWDQTSKSHNLQMISILLTSEFILFLNVSEIMITKTTTIERIRVSFSNLTSK